MEEQEHKQDYQSVTTVLSYQVLSWPVATCGCEACTLRKIAENKIQAFENKCARKLLRISWTRLLTAEEFTKSKSSWEESMEVSYSSYVTSRSKKIDTALMSGPTEGSRSV